MIGLSINNSRSQWHNLDPVTRERLRFELSYLDGDPGPRTFLQPDGSIRMKWWDGHRCLVDQGDTFPSGLIPRALRLLQKWGQKVHIEDMRGRPGEGVPIWSMNPEYQLRDYQLQAVDAAEDLGRGVIDSPPRSGKTVMMAELVRRISRPTVITAPTGAIAEQTMEKFRELLVDHGQGWSEGKPTWSLFLLSGGAPKTRAAQRELKRATCFIATADTAVRMPESWWRTIECWITDERHHQAAKTYHLINDLALRAWWRWGFTGTDFRSKPGEQVALEACLGRTVARYSIREMIAAGVLVPASCTFWPVPEEPRVTGSKPQTVYRRGIVKHKVRNKLIGEAALSLVRAGRKVLVLVHELVHGEAIQKEVGPGSIFVAARDGDQLRKVLKDLDTGTLRCVIGSPVVGEGLDVPSADALVYAKGRKARVTHTQDTFRVLTGNGVKKEALIIDFADRQSMMLTNHSVARMKNYLDMGIRVEVQ